MLTVSGKHSDDISHDFASGFGLTSIFPDPDHRGLIFLNVWCKHREFVLQADDKTYAWDGATKLGDWRRKHDPENCFFAAEHSTATENFEYRANLIERLRVPIWRSRELPWPSRSRQAVHACSSRMSESSCPFGSRFA